jgi:mannose-6-phosphate isomerase-like protein (cupin superfamily)
MNPILRGSLAGLGLAAALSAGAQQLPAGVVMVDPSKASPSNWIASPSGEILRLHGDLTQPGPWSILLKVRKGRIGPSAAHTHPENRTYTVVAGTWYVGFGSRFDESKLIGLPPGSFYTEPAGVPHFVMARDDGVIVQISGSNGPTRQDFLEKPDAK